MNEEVTNPYAPPRSEVVTAHPVENPVRRGDELVICFDRTVEDWVRTSIQHYKAENRRSVGKWIQAALWWVLLVGLLWYLFRGAPAVPIGIAAVAAISLTLNPLLLTSRLRKSFTKLYSAEKAVGMLEPVELSISPRGLGTSCASGYGLIYWQAVERIEANADGIVIHTNTLSLLPIPARAFPSHEAMEEVVSEARRYQSGG